MAVAIQVLYFAPTVTCHTDKVGWILVSKNAESGFKFVLFNITMGGEIFA